MKYLKLKGSLSYQIIMFFVGYFLILIPAAALIIIDNLLVLNGSLSIPGIAVEVVLLICYFVFRRREKFDRKEYDSIEKGNKQYSLDRFKSDFEDEHEIEFVFDSERYLFIHESDKYYFKRIKSIDPYEYEILTEADSPEKCIDAAEINNKNISEFLNIVEDLTVY